MIRGFSSISEKDVLAYACKGICEVILKAPLSELDNLNQQYSEMYQRRKAILAEEADAPFECD